MLRIEGLKCIAAFRVGVRLLTDNAFNNVYCVYTFVQQLLGICRRGTRFLQDIELAMRTGINYPLIFSDLIWNGSRLTRLIHRDEAQLPRNMSSHHRQAQEMK